MASYHVAAHAAQTPDKPAVKFFPSGYVLSYGELDARSNQAAHLLREQGLGRGAVIAILLENHPCYYELAWAADRAGLYYTGISSRLTPSEIAYILEDSGASVLFTWAALAHVAREALGEVSACVAYHVDGPAGGFRDYLDELSLYPESPVDDESCGTPMLYSSGTTGRPKGVKFPLPDGPIGQLDGLVGLATNRFGYEEDMIYLSPAPLYHAAPLRWSMTVHRCGGTVIVMERFDAEDALAIIEAERVTHSQWVPTHFVRMLKLPEDIRIRYDLSSQKLAFHASAPCPVPIKEAMLDWWGPIIHEYYSGTEFNGLTSITPREWLKHPGSVGKAIVGTLHICSDEGETELACRKEGLVFFENGTQFQYHNDPAKTAEAHNSKGWSTLGDIGWVDEDGFLYLTDRKCFMIISGGVNIYPQEIENAIIGHPLVADVAVFGIPDDDLGEVAIAIVQPLRWEDAGTALEADILAGLAGNLSRIKTPRRIEFLAELPRHPTGKLYKRLLRDRYWTTAPAKSTMTPRWESKSDLPTRS